MIKSYIVKINDIYGIIKSTDLIGPWVTDIVCQCDNSFNDIEVITIHQVDGKTVAYIDQNKVNEKQQRLHDESIQNGKREIRSQRDKHLSNTDFTVLVDAPFTSTMKTKYKKYRKYLREYPDTVVDFLNERPKTFKEWNK